MAHLLNLEVDLIFFDTTSTYFETEEEDDFRRFGWLAVGLLVAVVLD